MSNLSMFFAQNASTETTEDYVVSKRFKDEGGNPVPWKIRSLSERMNKEIRKAATKRTKGKNGVYTADVDSEAYMSRLIAESVVYPDLKNAELQGSYGVKGADELLGAMLLPGEFGALGQRVQALNGFDVDVNEVIEEVKN